MKVSSEIDLAIAAALHPVSVGLSMSNGSGIHLNLSGPFCGSVSNEHSRGNLLLHRSQSFALSSGRDVAIIVQIVGDVLNWPGRIGLEFDLAAKVHLARPALQEHSAGIRQPDHAIHQEWIWERLHQIALRGEDQDRTETFFLQLILRDRNEFPIRRP